MRVESEKMAKALGRKDRENREGGLSGWVRKWDPTVRYHFS